MQKIAQRRGIFNKLREMTDFSGKITEKYFNPEFKKVMTNLRKTDNNLRSIVAGESIGEEVDDETKEKFKGDPGKYKISMKQLLKQAKSNLNRREYMKAAGDFGIFHDKVNEVTNEIGKFVNSVDDFHHQFLFGTEDEPALTEEQFKALQGLKERWKESKRQQDELTKEAGLSDIADFLHNTFRDRGRALSAYEKRYGKQTEKLKKDAHKLLGEAEGVLSQTLALLKEMASARAVRNPDNYLGFANKLADKNKNFDAKFKTFYTENVKGFLEKAKIYPTKTVKDTGIGNQEVGGGPSPSGATPTGEGSLDIPSPPSGRSPTTFESAPTALIPPSKPGAVVPKQETMGYGSPGAAHVAPPAAVSPPHAPPARQTLIGLTPAPGSAPGATDPSQLVPPNEFNKSESVAQQILSQNPDIAKKLSEPTTGAHGKFYDTLEKMSEKPPAILSAFISKYAKSIQGSDPETAIKLFKIANSVKG